MSLRSLMLFELVDNQSNGRFRPEADIHDYAVPLIPIFT